MLIDWKSACTTCLFCFIMLMIMADKRFYLVMVDIIVDLALTIYIPVTPFSKWKYIPVKIMSSFYLSMYLSFLLGMSLVIICLDCRSGQFSSLHVNTPGSLPSTQSWKLTLYSAHVIADYFMFKGPIVSPCCNSIIQQMYFLFPVWIMWFRISKWSIMLHACLYWY